MKRGWSLSLLVISTLFIFVILFPIKADAGEAGVGVESPPPQFSIVRLEQWDNNIRIYLTVCDINSWEDIYFVNIILEDAGANKAEFIYKQYEDDSSWNKINEFSEIPASNNLLVTKKCSYDHINKEETLTGCYLNLLFVFESTWFTGLNITALDRGGADAYLQLDYSSEDLARRGNIIIIPGITEPFALGIPPYLLDIIAIIIAAIGTWYFVKKSDIEKIMRVIYEKD